MRLGNYEWDPDHDLIAAGAFAEVFRARDTNTAGRTVALKIYKEAVAKGTSGSSGQKKYTLEKEFHNVDGLSHTNIIAYYGLDYIHGQDAMGRQTSYPVLIMEYAEDGTLTDFLKTNPDDAVREKLIREIIQGLGYLHEQGILHRDLKPGNILITKDRRGNPVAKITDFGISRDLVTDKTLEQSYTEGVGTPHYMAPEQFFKKKFGLKGELSERTDLWAVGVIVYRMVTGRLPFGEGERDLELVRDAITGKNPDFDKVPARYRGLLEKCLAKNATDRMGSAAALLGLLEGRVSVPPPPTPFPGAGKGSGEGDRSPDDLPTMPPVQGPPVKPPRAQGKEIGVAAWTGVVWVLLVAAVMVIYFSSQETKRFVVEETKAYPVEETGTVHLPVPVQKLMADIVEVEGGTFTMGCTPEQGGDCFDSERPAHQVTLSGFGIGKYEVTQAQWAAVMGTNPSHSQNCDECPVEKISWDDIQEFLQKLNGITGKSFRLPTEAEWEYAARGGNKSMGYKYPGSDNLAEVAWYNEDSGNKTHPVGGKKPNELGLYDMGGNVWEWCQDWYGEYTGAAQTNPTGPARGAERVSRGGAWHNSVRGCRVSYRDAPEYGGSALGFRVALGGGVDLRLEGNDQMQFDLKELKVREGQTVRLTLNYVGTMAKNAMGHNFVLLKEGVDLAAFGQKAARAMETGYIPASEKGNIIAHTKMLGGGESDTIEFKAPAKGTYEFLCSFPGHYALMRGVFIVE